MVSLQPWPSYSPKGWDITHLDLRNPRLGFSNAVLLKSTAHPNHPNSTPYSIYEGVAYPHNQNISPLSKPSGQITLYKFQPSVRLRWFTQVGKWHMDRGCTKKHPRYKRAKLTPLISKCCPKRVSMFYRFLKLIPIVVANVTFSPMSW